MKLLVGSMAARQWFPEFREPKDIDYLITDPSEKRSNTRGIEYFYHPLLATYIDKMIPYTINGDILTATPDMLYTIKVSHAFWQLRNRSWEKHMHDVLFFQEKECKLIENFYDVLYQTWVEVHGAKKANLNVPASEFFTKTIDRKYDHDSIHSSVAYGEQPLYEKILRDGSEVSVSKDKFEALSFDDKCNLVREEVYATALERILIPSDYKKSPRAAYAWALRQTITSFSKGWFPKWVVENYTHLYKPDVDYVTRHRDNADKLILLEA